MLAELSLGLNFVNRLKTSAAESASPSAEKWMCLQKTLEKGREEKSCIFPHKIPRVLYPARGWGDLLSGKVQVCERAWCGRDTLGKPPGLQVWSSWTSMSPWPGTPRQGTVCVLVAAGLSREEQKWSTGQGGIPGSHRSLGGLGLLRALGLFHGSLWVWGSVWGISGSCLLPAMRCGVKTPPWGTPA